MSLAIRKNVTSAMLSLFGKRQAQEYENLIFNTCKKLCKEYDQSLEEVYPKYAYQKVGLLAQTENVEEVVNDISRGSLGWESSSYNPIREKIKKANEDYTVGVKIEKGEFACRNRDCRSKECYYWSQQDRSSDEGQSTYVMCTKCGTRYRFN